MFATSDDIRARFSAAMSDMYRQEVPLYGDLLDLVARVNGPLADAHGVDGPAARVAIERHGAIRLGTAAELATMRRVLAVMGMVPVGYYDLSQAGIPVHATAFRPRHTGELDANPFRLFTSLLRPELIADAALRERAMDILSRRVIFTDRLMELVKRHAEQGGLSEDDAQTFVGQALETFRWHSQAPVTQAEYVQMLATHRLVADIVCFKGPHINHLTPRTLDIDAAQDEMLRRGIPAKRSIEGPPRRRHPILLRQTSFKALEEAVTFYGDATGQNGTHTARFGEIEQRGQALTPRGRALYDRLLHEGRETGDMEAAFRAFPDDLQQIHAQGLGYFEYRLTPEGQRQIAHFGSESDLPQWIARGWVSIDPVTYEDFLPVSAAGIFRSNLGGDAAVPGNDLAGPDRARFERALGAPVLDEFALYAEQQARSFSRIREARDNASRRGESPHASVEAST